MPDDVFIAINGTALHAKSKVYIGRAIAKKAANDLDEYQLWASLALELLGKAALAFHHPSLIVDPTNWKSLFVAAGIKTTTDVKTIAARTLFDRLAHLVPRFDPVVQKFCVDISERRNAELHSADIPFRAMRLDAWEARYWHACDAILRHFNSSLEDWLGAHAEAPRRIVEEAAAATDAAVKLQVETARTQFEALKKGDREALAAAAGLLKSNEQVSLFGASYDEIWAVACPACQSLAFMAGDQTGEEISQEPGEDAIWEIVEREFVGEAFRCPACKLNLSGSDELTSAGLEYLHNDEVEREMDYEPDYGND
jgi:hypothetical protein